MTCMQGLLQCLEKKTRITLVLGELFQMSAKEASDILGITTAAYRKRLSRGREKVSRFVLKHCGLVDPDNDCRCSKLIGPDIRDKWIDPDDLKFAEKPCVPSIMTDVQAHLSEFEEIERTMELFRSCPEYASPESVVDIVKEMIDSKQFKILHH